MKFPLNPNPKSSNITGGRNPNFHNNQINNNSNITFCYEPTSVLDLRRTPSPIATATAAVVHEKPDSAGTEISTLSDALAKSDELPVQWDENLLQNFDDWDSIMRDLGLHDDSVSIVRDGTTADFSDSIQTPLSDYNFSDAPDLNHQQHVPNYQNVNYTNFDFDSVEELIRAAGCFDSGELQLAQVILSRLNQRLRSPVGKPLQRAAFYFKEALSSLLSYSTNNHRTVHSSPSEIVSTIKAFKAFSAISPVPMFSNFTANQAVLEAVEGSMFVHIIDFDIGFGGQYASFMKEIADRSDVRKSNYSVIRVSAVVTEDYASETRLIRDNLCQFAQELRINFHIEFVSICAFETSSFKSIKFIEGEKVAVLLSPTIIRRIGHAFYSDLRRISPRVVVFVDEEVFVDSVGTSSFRRAFVEGLEYYSMMLESLDAAANADWVRKIETCLLRRKITSAVEAAAKGRSETGREAFIGAGMRSVVLSQFAEFQAECLLRKAQVRGFHVAKRQGELLLCWNGRPMVATSAWRC